jgi:outer membrane protein assembly factor BamA
MGFPSGIFAQDIFLYLQAEKPISEGLKDSIGTPFKVSDLQFIEKKADTLQQILAQLGYIDNEFVEIEKTTDTTYTAVFILGQQYPNVKVRYNQTDFSKKELQSISADISDTHFTLPISSIPRALTLLADINSNKGHPFTKLRLSEIEKNTDGTLHATLLMDEGKARSIDSIVIKGYEKFPRSYLKYYAGVKEGQIFNRKKLIEHNERINSLGFASTTKAPEALYRKDSTTVYFYLKKENNNHFDGILGFATDEITQKVVFNGYLNLILNNNLNYGEQFSINYKADGNKQIEFKTNLALPYLFKSRFGASGALAIFKRDTSFVTTERQLRTTFQAAPRSQIYIGYRHFSSNNLQEEAIAGAPIDNFNSKYFVFGGSYTRTQNNKMFPIKTKGGIDLGVGKRNRKNIKADQWRLEGHINHIFQLSPRSSFFINNTTSILISDTYLENELFRFGGINSIRGFDENSIDASLYSTINTEYRLLLDKNIFIHSIIDAGYFENQTLSIQTELISFGFGLGLDTKGGIFRLLVANGRTAGQQFDFSSSKIHISISSRF